MLVIVPTYNERDNIEIITGRLRTAVPDVDLLIVDDGSPDGTGDIADKLAAHDDQVHVLHRTSKAGLGAAYVAGFGWALERGYDVAVEMDADGSHAPEQLPRLLAALHDADLVLGARWVDGGEVENWPLSRKLLSRGGNTYARVALGIPLHDATGGFRAYRRAVLEGIDVSDGRLPGLLLPGRPRLAGVAQRLPGRRGADHVRRAGARRVQDEQRDRGRGAVAGHRVGRQVDRVTRPAPDQPALRPGPALT